MKEIISKELLSEVLKRTVDIVYTKDYLGNEFKTFIRPRYGDFVDEINIYELAHKCKEWAFSIGRSLCTCPSTLEVGLYECYDRDFDDMQLYYAETEPEAIFKACQWILDNKDK